MGPDILLTELDRALPGFAGYFQSPDNLHDGGTLCAIFAACSDFVRERSIAAECWPQLANIVNTAVVDEAAAEAACTCFLENIAEPSHPLKPFLSREALEYWTSWEA